MSKFVYDVWEDFAEPSWCKELGNKGCIGLELIWQPGNNCLLQGDDLVWIKKSDQLIVDQVLIKSQLNILAEFVWVSKLGLNSDKAFLKIGLNCVIKLIDEGRVNMIALNLHWLGKWSIQSNQVHENLLTQWQVFPEILFNSLKTIFELCLSLVDLWNEPFLYWFFKAVWFEQGKISEGTHCD